MIKVITEMLTHRYVYKLKLEYLV